MLVVNCMEDFCHQLLTLLVWRSCHHLQFCLFITGQHSHYIFKFMMSIVPIPSSKAIGTLLKFGMDGNLQFKSTLPWKPLLIHCMKYWIALLPHTVGQFKQICNQTRGPPVDHLVGELCLIVCQPVEAPPPLLFGNLPLNKGLAAKFFPDQ